jgi:DNA helicase-2/ATP-dependent DNA helicase PcrA
MIDVPYEQALLIAGPSRSGKSTALRERAAQYAQPAFFASHPGELVQLAQIVLEASGRDVRVVDEIVARRTFDRCLEPLFDLTWSELERRQIDPEIAALRSPERFADAAYRLLRKLRDAAIDAPVFLSKSLGAATSFYAAPPNFAHADLILATKDAYRDSLAAGPAELERQYRRELDLTKTLGALFEAYERAVATMRELSASDAVLAALSALASNGALASAVRDRYTHVFIDDMQEATIAQRRLLDALFGSPLANVSLAGDARAATSTFRGARPDVTLRDIARTVELPPAQARPAPALHRTKTEADEAAYVARYVRDLIERGAAPDDIALIFRSSADVQSYTDALLDADLPVAVGGDLNVFCDRRALDAIALLWNVWDPFRHEWMLRTLAGRALVFSDSTVATLCSDPPDPQRALFVLDDEPSPTARTSRWDPKRDVRLGWNVIRGDQDAQLNEIARERITAFRTTRLGWIAMLGRVPFRQFVRTVWNEGLALDGTAGSARARAQAHLLNALLDRLCELAHARPQASLGDILNDVYERSQSDAEPALRASKDGFVHALSIDAARGRGFEHVIIPDARPGSFPRWYVPDAFLWSPKYGMIPRENVGDASAARTAKFTYYLHVSKARDAYNTQERRAFEYACSRATNTLLITASGSATRGITAPEFLEELRAAR